jgi:hypothetical protein
VWESLARLFDAPFDSPEHATVKEHGWIGGTQISSTYYLGMLLSENLFRIPDETVREKTREFLVDETSPEGARVMEDVAGYDFAVELLRFRFYERYEPEKAKANKRYLALKLLLTDPNIAFDRLAASVGTTIKQLARHSTLTYAAKILKQLGVREERRE